MASSPTSALVDDPPIPRRVITRELRRRTPSRQSALEPTSSVLLAPVTITPTKPLTPSHVKFLLWMDVLNRATSFLSDVTCVYHHRTFAVTQQVLKFWSFLDRRHPGLDYATMADEEIGDLYVRSHSDPARDLDTGPHHAARVEGDGWFHPASARLLDLWEHQYRVIGLTDPGLGRHGPPLLGTDEVLARLGERLLSLDLRPWGGPVYLDASAHGVPLRQVIDPAGRPNYLLCALRELLPLAGRFDRTVLACDGELGADYRLLARILDAFGARTSRIEVTRVPVGGESRSSRHGGWQGYSLGALIRRFVPEYGESAFRLGLRLYLIAGLGMGSSQSFDHDHLRRQLDRARQLRDRAGLAGPEVHGGSRELRDYLAGLAGPRGYVDPYRLTTALLSRHRRVPRDELLGTVFA